MINEFSDEFLKLRVNKEITRLYKTFLNLLHDIKTDHENLILNLKEVYPNETVEIGNYLSDIKLKSYRSKILGAGNDCWREIENEIARYDISIKIN